ncbi:MAG: CVNH domain-containing protein [Lyngbya sp.]|nr:CVNH domain-containing protein [Lyngbya sp.]
MNKLTSFVKASVALLFVFALSFGLFTNSAFAGKFSLTCYNTSISGSTLYSSCERADGYTINETSINLNSIIENVDGSLMWQPSNFFETCRGLSLDGGSIMTAECKTRDQRWNSTKINLDDHIANIDGTLRYE